MYTDSTKQPILDDQWYTHPKTGTKYPPGYPRDLILGLTEVTETPKPDGENIVVSGFTINEDFEQVWEYREKTEEELSAELNASIKSQIAALEAQQTPRRLREAALGNSESLDFLSNLETQIAALRAQLGG